MSKGGGDGVRPGNRGGAGLFKWQDVKTQSYKDRELYLGASTQIGYLDRSGKWIKNDWYHSKKKEKKSDDEKEF